MKMFQTSVGHQQTIESQRLFCRPLTKEVPVATNVDATIAKCVLQQYYVERSNDWSSIVGVQARFPVKISAPWDESNKALSRLLLDIPCQCVSFMTRNIRDRDNIFLGLFVRALLVFVKKIEADVQGTIFRHR